MKNKIIKAIKKALDKLNLSGEVELTPSKGHADFSTNIAFKLSKDLGKAPIEIANEIAKNIDSKIIERTEVAMPGFINLFLNNQASASIINEIISKGENFGKGNENKYINIEYVSANPTGYLHLGHARGAALGDSLARILRFAGNKVDEEYYINDAGNQMEILADSVIARMKKTKLPEDSYKGEDIIAIAKKIKSTNREEIKKEAEELLLQEIKNDLKKFGIEINLYSSEQEIKDSGAIKETLKKLSKAEATFEKDGALWLNTLDKGDDKNRVLIKSDKRNTYLLPDIAYHNIKISRGYDQLINIWGSDHIGYIKRMEIALEYLGLPKENLNILTVQLVRLIKDGKEFKMSKRDGTSFTLRELLSIVGKDAARFNLIQRSNTSVIDFDVDQATKLSSENPVFTLQYTHARTYSLLKKSAINPKAIKVSGKHEEALTNILSKFPEVIKTIAKTHKVHLLSQYLIDLAKAFNSLYAAKTFIGSEEESSLLALTKATQIVLKNALTLIGVSAPKKM